MEAAAAGAAFSVPPGVTVVVKGLPSLVTVGVILGVKRLAVFLMVGADIVADGLVVSVTVGVIVVVMKLVVLVMGVPSITGYCIITGSASAPHYPYLVYISWDAG